MLKKYRIYGYARVYVDVVAFDEEDAFMSAQGTDLSDYVIERLDAVEEIADVLGGIGPCRLGRDSS